MHTRLPKFLSILVITSILLSACTARQTPLPPAPTSPPTASPLPTSSRPPLPTPTPAPTPTLQPAQFIPSACPFRPPTGLTEGETIECGYLSVPANRRNPAAGTLQLATAIIHPPDGTTHNEPIVYLEGGPGGSALEMLYLRYAGIYAPLLETGRDLIIFDQRGVGLSRPALDCPEQDQMFLELLDNEINGSKQTELEANQLNVRAMQTCRQNWAARTDLTGFTTAENAADVADIAHVLGNGKINLWGISYGTRLGLEVMRSHPEVVRSAILDSNLPPDVDPYASQPANMARSFELLFDSCAGDEACNGAYPDLRQVFFNTAEKLDAENAAFSTTDPLTGQSYNMALSGDVFTELIFSLLYDPTAIPLLPRLIFNASQGNFDLLARLAGTIIATQTALSDLMHYSLQCAEDIGRTNPEALRQAAEEQPDFLNYFDENFIQQVFDICKAIEVSPGVDLALETAVQSQIPSLVMAGEFDPVTPPEWGERIAATLDSSYLYEFIGLSHGVSIQPGCPRQMMMAFLDNPSHKPDAACLDEMPSIRYDVPTTGEIEMETFTSDIYGLQGVRPTGWKEVNTGVFSRQNSSLDATLVMAQSAQGTTETMLQGLVRQFGLTQTPTSHSQRTANKLDWSLYTATVRGMQIDFALAQSGESVFVVLLQSAVDERDVLITNVFLPVIDSIKPSP